MTKVKKAGAAATAAILAATTVRQASATVISGWDFENYTSQSPVNTPASDLGPVAGTADAIGMSNSYNSTTSTNTDDVLTGKSSDTGVNSIADKTQEWRVRGQNPGNGWSSQAPIGTQGAQFFASTAGYGGINISFDWYVTNQAESNLQLEYTTNGSAWTNIPITIPASDTADLTNVTNSGSDSLSVTGSYVSVTGSSGQDWFPGLTATISDPNAVNDPSFGIELVNASTGADVLGAAGGAYNNSSGNWRFDNVSINGVVPEPASAGLLGLAGLGLLNRRRSRTK